MDKYKHNQNWNRNTMAENSGHAGVFGLIKMPNGDRVMADLAGKVVSLFYSSHASSASA
jgi:hypothetical protein